MLKPNLDMILTDTETLSNAKTLNLASHTGADPGFFAGGGGGSTTAVYSGRLRHSN